MGDDQISLDEVPIGSPVLVLAVVFINGEVYNGEHWVTAVRMQDAPQQWIAVPPSIPPLFRVEPIENHGWRLPDVCYCGAEVDKGDG
jgi:hypothetical protein